jgi:anti-sigma B factor antagonist
MLLQIVERKIEPDVAVLELTGKLALGRESQKIETFVDQMVQQGARKTIVDMTGVDYIDSAGIGLLTLVAGKLKKSGSKLAFVVPAGRVLQLLEMTDITTILKVVPTLAEATDAVGGQQASA